ncbi:MAG: hypothetical protein LH606_01710 [Cytophagaceae bacterium]|nr:hypothetical protein [Cytophagaceae bacterium]
MHDEMDELLRKNLDARADAPPPGPGLTFDADALWRALDAELRPRRRVKNWWVAAAVALLLMVLGSGWWSDFSVEKKPRGIAGQNMTRKPIPTNDEKFIAVVIIPAPRPVAQRPESAAKSKLATQFSQPKQNTERVAPTPEPTELMSSLANVAARPVEPQPVILDENPLVNPTPPPPTVATRTVKTRSQSRFRVVHANEIMAEEEARPKLHREEGFVRVFISIPAPPEANRSELHRPLILSTKANQ